MSEQTFYVRHASNAPAVTKNCPCEICERELAPLDALGRPVPEWAREAFDVLAADAERLDAKREAARREFLAFEAGIRHDPPVRGITYPGQEPLRVAMEAERKAEIAARLDARRAAAQAEADAEARRYGLPCALPVVAVPSHSGEDGVAKFVAQRQRIPPMDEAKRAEVLDALQRLSSDWHAPIDRDAEPEPAPPRRHNATCPRCYGPAYVGLGLPRCEREGGCLADREPDWRDIRVGVGLGGEPFWTHALAVGGSYATRDLAVTAWRGAILDRAKREAGR